MDGFDPTLDTVTGRVCRTVHLEEWLDPANPAQADIPGLLAADLSAKERLSFDFRRIEAGSAPSDPTTPAIRRDDGGTPDTPADDRYYFECRGAWGDVVEVQSSSDLVQWTHFLSQSVGMQAPSPTTLSMDVTAAVGSRSGPLFFRARTLAPTP